MNKHNDLKRKERLQRAKLIRRLYKGKTRKEICEALSITKQALSKVLRP